MSSKRTAASPPAGSPQTKKSTLDANSSPSPSKTATSSATNGSPPTEKLSSPSSEISTTTATALSSATLQPPTSPPSTSHEPGPSPPSPRLSSQGSRGSDGFTKNPRPSDLALSPLPPFPEEDYTFHVLYDNRDKDDKDPMLVVYDQDTYGIFPTRVEANLDALETVREHFGHGELSHGYIENYKEGRGDDGCFWAVWNYYGAWERIKVWVEARRYDAEPKGTVWVLVVDGVLLEGAHESRVAAVKALAREKRRREEEGEEKEVVEYAVIGEGLEVEARGADGVTSVVAKAVEWKLRS